MKETFEIEQGFGNKSRPAKTAAGVSKLLVESSAHLFASIRICVDLRMSFLVVERGFSHAMSVLRDWSGKRERGRGL